MIMKTVIIIVERFRCGDYVCVMAKPFINLMTLYAMWDTGVATAFAAPIGGLLFMIEEGASFYSTSILWRGFLSTGIGVLTLHFLVEAAVRMLTCLSAHAFLPIHDSGVVCVCVCVCVC
jgi:hypothetical protein